MANVFDTILTKGVRDGQIPARTNSARAWYRDAAKSYNNVDERSLLGGDKTRMVNVIRPGRMYMYMYDPKHKDTLPFYDRFPVIFPFRVEGDRFWGINLHYLPHKLRAQLMDVLYDLANNSKYDDTTKLNLSYQALRAAAKAKYIEPCVKQYLFSQLKSKFFYVYPAEWDTALMLPLERFSKASSSQVWEHYAKKANR